MWRVACDILVGAAAVLLSVSVNFKVEELQLQIREASTKHTVAQKITPNSITSSDMVVPS